MTNTFEQQAGDKSINIAQSDLRGSSVHIGGPSRHRPKFSLQRVVVAAIVAAVAAVAGTPVALERLHATDGAGAASLLVRIMAAMVPALIMQLVVGGGWLLRWLSRPEFATIGAASLGVAAWRFTAVPWAGVAVTGSMLLVIVVGQRDREDQ